MIARIKKISAQRSSIYTPPGDALQLTCQLPSLMTRETYRVSRDDPGRQSDRPRAGRNSYLESAGGLVGAGRFERPTPCAQGRCATRLRYAPTCKALLILKHFVTKHPAFIASPAQN